MLLWKFVNEFLFEHLFWILWGYIARSWIVESYNNSMFNLLLLLLLFSHSGVWLSCNPMDCSLPGSSVHGIFQARILEWVAISFSMFNLVRNHQTVFLSNCIILHLYSYSIYIIWGFQFLYILANILYFPFFFSIAILVGMSVRYISKYMLSLNDSYLQMPYCQL